MNTPRSLLAGLLLVTGVGLPTSIAADIYVDASNPACPGTGTPADPYCTIQLAIDQAIDGDTVHVAAGTYLERIDFQGKAIAVVSDSGPDVTTIDAGLNGSVVTIVGGTGPAMLSGFTLTRGYQRWLGAGVFVYGTSPTIENNVITGCSTDSSGGAVHGVQSSLILRANWIVENSAYWLGGGVFLEDCSGAVIEGNTIRDNGATAGGGAYLVGCADVTLRGNTFEGHWVTSTGGGMSIEDSSSILVESNLVTGNESSSAAGIELWDSEVVVRSNEIVSNRTNEDSGGGLTFYGGDVLVEENLITDNGCRGTGGAIYAYSPRARIVSNVIVENHASGLGDGIAWVDSDGIIEKNTITGHDYGIICWGVTGTIAGNVLQHNSGGVLCWERSAPHITGNRVLENGAGVMCLPDSSPLIERNLLKGNGSSGIVVDRAAAVISSNVIVENSTPELGGGIYCSGEPAARIVGNTLAFNHADVGGGGIACFDSAPTIVDTILWKNTAPTDPQIHFDTVPPVVSHCDVEGGWPGTGNIDTSPRFVDPAQDDYSLRLRSPCLDAGDPLSRYGGTDYLGNPRRLDGDLDRTMIVDIGAHEYDHVRLSAAGPVPPGGTLTLHVEATPGLVVRLLAGRRPGEQIVPPFGAVLFDLTAPWYEDTIWLLVPPGGTVDRSITIPMSVRPPIDLTFQAFALHPPNWAGNLSAAAPVRIE